jgi:hypothetical protein
MKESNRNSKIKWIILVILLVCSIEIDLIVDNFKNWSIDKHLCSGGLSLYCGGKSGPIYTYL